MVPVEDDVDLCRLRRCLVAFLGQEHNKALAVRGDVEGCVPEVVQRGYGEKLSGGLGTEGVDRGRVFNDHHPVTVAVEKLPGVFGPYGIQAARFL